MDYDVERTLRPELGPGEKLLWSGRPHGAPFFWMANSA
jgi:hypothetical protein